MSLTTIILPYYKKSQFIDQTIQSILNQTNQKFEIIIVDDELSDQSSKIMNKLKNIDQRINIIINDKNIGAGLSRNKAIKTAKGDYIAFCDCDDLWDKFKLEKQIEFMNKKNIDFCFTAYNIINENGKIIGNRTADFDITFKKLVQSCDIGLSTVIIRKNLFEKFKFFFPNLKTKEDYVLWLYLSKNGIKMFGIKENLVSWRKSKNSLSSSSVQKILDGYKVYRYYLKYNFLKSIRCLFVLSLNFIFKK